MNKDRFDIERYFVQNAMIKYGGSFVKKLGEMLTCADHQNACKIQKSWSEEWTKYYEMGKQDSHEYIESLNK